MRRYLVATALLLCLAGCKEADEQSANTKLDPPAEPLAVNSANLISAGAEPKHELRLRIDQGDRAGYVTKLVSEVNDPVDGHYTTEMTYTTLMRANSMMDGIVKARVAFDGLDIKIRGSEQLQKQAPRIKKGIETVRMGISFDYKGKVLGIFTTRGEPEEQEQVVHLSNFDTGFQQVVYPEDPVGPGASWTVPVDLDKQVQQGNAEVTLSATPAQMTYELVSIDEAKQAALIRYSVSGKVAASAAVQPNSRFDIDVSIQGERVVSLETGLPLSGKETNVQKSTGTDVAINRRTTTEIKYKGIPRPQAPDIRPMNQRG